LLHNYNGLLQEISKPIDYSNVKTGTAIWTVVNKVTCRKLFLCINVSFWAMRWLVGFVFHETAFGLLSVFIPLYVIGTLKGSLTDVGIMMALANFAAVPFSFFWGYLSEKTRRYKLYILISFLGISISLYLFSLTDMIGPLLILYALISVFQVAHETPKNVLISENYPRTEWQRNFGVFQLLTGLGWLIGLFLGLVLTICGFGGTFMLVFCCMLNLIAFVVSVFSVKDPDFIFERKLVSIERSVSLVNRGFYLFSRALNGHEIKEKVGENVSALCFGLLAFTLTTSMLFTPLPIFFSNNLQLQQSFVFGAFMLNTSGSLIGYFLSARKTQSDDRATVKKTTLARTIFMLIFLSAVWLAILPLELSILALLVMGVTYGFFLISILSLSMELIPEGKAGLFNLLTGLGGAAGCLLGPYIAENFGFPALFLVSVVGFFLSYAEFRKLHSKENIF